MSPGKVESSLLRTSALDACNGGDGLFDQQTEVQMVNREKGAQGSLPEALAPGQGGRGKWQMSTLVPHKGLLPQLGLERFHGVGIMGLNSEEWVIANIGAIMAG